MELKWDYVGVVSADLRRSVEFYRLVGIPLPEAESDHVEVELENGMRFALDSLELMKSIGHWEPPRIFRAPNRSPFLPDAGPDPRHRFPQFSHPA